MTEEERRGRGRPPEGRRWYLRLPDDVIDGLDRLAEEEGITRAALVRRILAEAVAR